MNILWSSTGIYDTGGNVCVPNSENNDAFTIAPDGEKSIQTDFFDTLSGMDIEDNVTGHVAKIIGYELENSYITELDNPKVMIDIGAHVGVVSIYFALKYPDLLIYAYEPVRENYRRLLRNIKSNNVEGQIKPFNLAVTADGRKVFMQGDISKNSGGSNIYGSSGEEVESITLQEIFNGIDRCSLLKMDCEGAEYEILDADLLKRCDVFTGEFHHKPGLDTDALLDMVEKNVPRHKVTVLGR